MRPTLPIAIAGLALAAMVATRPAVSDPVVTAIMKDLDQPRGLAFAPNGALFVAEAGHGGAPCTGTMGLNCYGKTGAVRRYWHGQTETVASGLPSLSFPQGAGARGPHDIAILGLGGARVTIGLEALASERDALHRDGLGWLVDIPASTLLGPPTQVRTDEWSYAVDMATHQETAYAQPRESDPYGLLAVPGGYVLADASANALMQIRANGEISTLAEFPSRPDRKPFNTDSVPTSVAVGPDGAYYVGEFTGFNPPPPDGNANVYRVAPGEDLQVFCAGFNRIIDIAFDVDGSLLVLQYATTAANTGPGVLWRVVPPPPDVPDRSCPDRARVNTGIVLDQPTAVAIGPDGALYISNRGGRAGKVGEVLRIER
jgi:hypothetical protein